MGSSESFLVLGKDLKARPSNRTRECAWDIGKCVAVQTRQSTYQNDVERVERGSCLAHGIEKKKRYTRQGWIYILGPRSVFGGTLAAGSLEDCSHSPVKTVWRRTIGKNDAKETVNVGEQAVGSKSLIGKERIHSDKDLMLQPAR